jgi:hypothetical protein
MRSNFERLFFATLRCVTSTQSPKARKPNMGECIDLSARFAHRYQIQNEESYQAERGGDGRLCDPWLLTIPCRFGHIYPHGGNYLAASTFLRGPVAGRLAALPCVCLVRDGDDGINVVFHVDDFDTVAAIMKPKRRRRLTAEQRVEQVERLRNYQFRPAAHDARKQRRRDPASVADAKQVN